MRIQGLSKKRETEQSEKEEEIKRVLNAAGNLRVEKIGEHHYFLARKWLLVISKENFTLEWKQRSAETKRQGWKGVGRQEMEAVSTRKQR